MTADDKYSLLNRDNLTQTIRIKLSQKLKALSQLFLPFSESILNFEHFQKKDDPDSCFFFKLGTLKNVVRYMSKKSRFKGPFDREHRKRIQTLLRSERHYRYHIY